MAFEKYAAALRRFGTPVTPETEGAARRVARVGELLEAEGWSKRKLLPRDKMPEGRWVDHPYVLFNRETNRTVLVSEPYAVTPDASASLAAMTLTDWNVTVSADRALYFPGLTVAIWLEKKPPSPAPLQTYGQLGL